MKADKLNQEIFDYTLFLLTAARGVVDEPHIYGSLRLVDAARRIIEIYFNTSKTEDEFLKQLKKMIDEREYIVMESEEKFTQFIDELIVKSVDEMKRRAGRI